jgi:hypothetical protein
MDRIGLILDKSGSMSRLQRDTIGGVNTFVKDQVKANPNALFTLTLFDTGVEILHDNVRVDAVPEVTEVTYAPAGGTALLDAVGNTVRAMERIAATDDRVLLCIITDGEENSSREWRREAIKELLTEKQAAGWGVIYIGANVDAFAEAGAIGVRSSVNYVATAAGTASAFSTSSGSTNTYFSTGQATINQADIDRATKENEQQEKRKKVTTK